MADANPPYAALALSVTVGDWNSVGIDPTTAPVDDFEAGVDRLAALLLVRIVAVACKDSFPNCTTSDICRLQLMRQEPWPAPITDAVVEQVRAFCKAILAGYRTVPYHNAQHAQHVVLSTNKLLDMLCDSSAKTFGLKKDPLMLAALIFSAIIHDVEHQGVPNRQLVLEDDELAILYNDQSVAEQRSIYVGFKELLSGYEDMRNVLFGGSADEYRRFRKHVVNLVLNTDIASPERTQLTKSKYKEAFPEVLRSDGRRDLANSIASLTTDPDEEEEDEEDEETMIKHVRQSKSEDAGDPVPARSIRRSHSAPDNKSFRQRLGIRRSMDLSGEALENFSSHGEDGDFSDAFDELKATVVMECIMTAADVAHNLQGWDQMVLWSSRLYKELRKAYVEDRSALDPSPRWFENQIGFLESYLLPLARRLEDTGVFGKSGTMFAENIEASRDRWLLEGLDVTEQTVKEGNAAFP